MNQFDVFHNPVASSKSAYPFVISLQSNASQGLKLQIVAPMTQQLARAEMTRHLMPEVQIDGQAYTVVMGQMTTMRLSALGGRVGSGESARAQTLAAIDLLFFGV